MDYEETRYRRQIILPSFGKRRQAKLLRSHVMIAGVGGLGSPAAIYSACAGIGRLTLIDSDVVTVSNLNRQILHWNEDIGRKKVASAKEKLHRLNPDIAINAIFMRISSETVGDLLGDVDLVVDCLDNMETRFVLNEACCREKIPMVHAGIYGVMGQITTIMPGRTPCLECIFSRDAERRESVPVFGATAGVMATLQVMEAIKILTGFGQPLIGKILYVNGENMEFLAAAIERKAGCVVCGGM